MTARSRTVEDIYPWNKAPSWCVHTPWEMDFGEMFCISWRELSTLIITPSCGVLVKEALCLIYLAFYSHVWYSRWCRRKITATFTYISLVWVLHTEAAFGGLFSYSLKKQWFFPVLRLLKQSGGVAISQLNSFLLIQNKFYIFRQLINFSTILEWL